MSGLLRLKYLSPHQLDKIRSVMNDQNETNEKRADAALLLRMHLSLNGKKPEGG